MRTGGAVGGDTFSSKERVCDFGSVSYACNIPIPISTEDISLRSSSPPQCYSFRLHFWYRLVGNRTQHDRLFRRGSCKFLIKCFYCLVYKNLFNMLPKKKLWFHCKIGVSMIEINKISTSFNTSYEL